MQWFLQRAWHGVASIKQGVFALCSGERITLLPASEWGFYVTQQDLPSNRPFLFKPTASHTEDQWQFVFCCHYPDFSRSCPMGLDLTVQDPACGRDAPMRGSPEDWWEALIFTIEAEEISAFSVGGLWASPQHLWQAWESHQWGRGL